MSVPRPDRRLLDVDAVRRLVAGQFPQWAGLPVRPVAVSGWDNQTFRLGERLSVRLPTAAEYARAVDKEHRWLPVFAPHLPLPIPVPVVRGEPADGYAFRWSVYEWIDGEPADTANIADLTGFAGTVAAFLVALRRVDPAGGPGPGEHNWFRGGPLSVYESQALRAMEALDGPTRRAAAAVWRSAMSATWDGRPVWFHGDVAVGNLLVRAGVLVAVIDFGTCGVGDPACDVVLAWTLLAGPSRDAFRAGLDVDDATWARGRGWALWKALITDDRRVVDEVIADY